MIQWITDFSNRIKQLDTISQLASQRGPSEIKVKIHCFKTGKGLRLVTLSRASSSVNYRGTSVPTQLVCPTS